MEYLFLRRKKTSSTSVRQKTLLYRAAGRDGQRGSRHCRMSVRQTALYIKVYCISWRYVGRSSIPLFR